MIRGVLLVWSSGGRKIWLVKECTCLDSFVSILEFDGEAEMYFDKDTQTAAKKITPRMISVDILRLPQFLH